MKTTFAFLIAFAALGAAAQEEQQPDVKVDYSKPALQRFVSSIPPEPKRDRNMHFYIGGVEFRALGTRYRFNYLPILAPLSGTRLGVTQEWPDPFSLTGTVIATPRRAWRTQRQVDAEMKRIEKTERAKIKVKVGSQ
jgi:hypothetical protein